MPKYTGKAGTMTWNSATLAITEANHKIAKSMADATDSDGYDSGTGQLYKSQYPGDVQLTLSIKGNFDSSTVPTTIYAAMFADAVVAVVTKINSTTTVVTGNFDVSDWESTITVPGGTMVDFSCTLVSNGLYTL